MTDLGVSALRIASEDWTCSGGAFAPLLGRTLDQQRLVLARD